MAVLKANKSKEYRCCAVLYRQVEAQAAGADISRVQHAATANPASIHIRPLNASARSTADSSAATGVEPCFVLLDTAWQGTQHLADIFEGIQRPCFGVAIPQVLELVSNPFVWQAAKVQLLCKTTSTQACCMPCLVNKTSQSSA